MTPTAEFKKGNEVKGVFTRFFDLLKPQKGLLFNIFLASLLITIFGILGSFYFKFLLDDIVPNNLRESLTIFSIGFILLAIFKVIIKIEVIICQIYSVLSALYNLIFYIKS